MKDVNGYRVIVKQELRELDAQGYLLEHEKTKARVVAIETEDDNKVFSIGFRTPPGDSTGVAHIVEHSVLCGSKDFPVKDPFVELEKGSLNTFLNAMTYPDKTVYPVASCNDKDFQNLMHVYLDAVFYPNIYKEEKIFKQEGWHYELEDVNGTLKYNGVVFNEMKGVFSSPKELLDRKIQQSLFPDNAYGRESGGDPVVIPDLTYEEFLDFHSRYYHPSNSYLYLYGDMDMAEKLAWIDENYLSSFDYLEVDSAIRKQKGFDKPVEVNGHYSLAEGESEENKAYFSYNAVTGTSLDRDMYIAFQVLNYVLVQGVGAPVKQALLDQGIGTEISGFFEESISQPYFSIIAKNVSADKKEQFVSVIREELEKLVRDGINRDSLNAGLNSMEFRYREADFGAYPKGLMYGLQIFDSWLYDGDQPFIHIRANDTFQKLREEMDSGYFESLIRTFLLDNTHRSVVTVEPKTGLTAQMEAEQAKRLQQYFETLTQEDKEKLVRETKELRQYQEEPSPKEMLEKIPLLAREDIGKKALGFSNVKKMAGDCPVIQHDYFTNGIHYINLYFNIKPLLSEYAPYISLLCSVLGCVDTDEHDKLSFSNEILQNAGDMYFEPRMYQSRVNRGQYDAYLVFGTKVFTDKTQRVLELLCEAVTKSHLDDKKRLREIIGEQRSYLEVRLVSAGHSTAVSRAMAYTSEPCMYDEQISGISYYRFLKELEENFEEHSQNLIQVLKQLMELIFVRGNMIAGVTCAKEDYTTFEKVFVQFLQKFPAGRKADDTALASGDAFVSDAASSDGVAKKNIEKPDCRCGDITDNEGFKTAGQVQYVARSGNFMDAGMPYTGVYKIVRSILSFDYLWNEVRVKGGAYGAMCGFGNTGEGYFVSYRDPKLTETNDVYKAVPEYLRNFAADERDMTKYIIGTISHMDVPLMPKAKGNRSMAAYFTGVKEEDVQLERDQVLAATSEDIRKAAEMVKAVLDADKICVLGNEDKVRENSALFRKIDTI